MSSKRYTILPPALGISVSFILLLSSCGNGDAPSATGLLEWDRLELTAEANEPILERVAHEGELLQAGAVILRQDPRRTQAQLDEANAALAQAQSRLAELKRGPREELIDEARARLQSAQSEEDNDRREFLRAQSLAEKSLISLESVDTARTRLKKAVADKNAALAALEALLHGTTAEELNQAEAAVAQAEARVQALIITLDNLILKAPRPGRLDNLPYQAGERPAAGSVIAVMLINAAPYARVYVPEPSRAQVHQGTKAMVYIDGLSDSFPGQVRMISSEAIFTPYYSLTERDRSRLSYVAEVELTDTGDARLPSGIPVRVEFEAAD
ncbi:MAG: HlyD family efflux transporter periplasmic adaptor subunit [Gammaproteobacteria bacterium]|nr:HlyD family efflux transporter periplasmic adaptor subunit [Gammaproteobacteria bacterium]MDH3535108.1 HlyD family efflux transporter periplasmic adaptor subunit [Gammaproteobacteria bacterium]